jgi:hypothetical protein
MADEKETKQVSPSQTADKTSNDQLKHTQGGTTTRDDATDVGVPMLPGSGDEPVGPEDALGEGPKRGDYSKRLGEANYAPHTTERIPDAKPGEAHTRLVEQAPRASEQGEVEGKKGGVETSA